MSKISDFEQKMIASGMTDDDFENFKVLLRRVPGGYNKRQHCYTTAIQFPKHRIDQAVRLINYGISEIQDDHWYSLYTSYLFLGQLYQESGHYEKAYEAFCQARNALGEERKAEREDISLELLWMRLHMDDFRYSLELEELYSSAREMDGLGRLLARNEYRFAVAQAIIAQCYGCNEDAKQAHERAMALCQPGQRGKLHKLLLAHGYEEQLNPTLESLDYLKK